MLPAETNRTREPTALGSALDMPYTDTTTWTRPQQAPGLDKRHSELFFSAGGFFFRSLRIQTYSIEGNKQFQCKENPQHRVLHTPRGMRMKKEVSG